MLVFFILVVFSCIGVMLNAGEVKPCQGDKLYMLEGQLVEIDGSTIKACKNSTKTSHVKPKLFDSETVLAGIYSVRIVNVIWPPFHLSSRVNEVYMEDVTPVGVWGGCSELQKLQVYSINVTQISPDWLRNCTQLRLIHFTCMTAADVHAILDTTVQVEHIIIGYLIESFRLASEPLFPTSRNQHQWLRSIELHLRDYFDADCSGYTLISSNISTTEISSSIVSKLATLPNLKALLLSASQLDFCSSFNFETVTFNSLQSLELSYTNTSGTCFRELRRMPQLSELKLLNNVVSVLQFSEMYAISGTNLDITFEQSNILPKFIFTRADYINLIKDSRNVTINTYNKDLEVVCNCIDSLWLARVLDEGNLVAPNLVCTDGSKINNQPCEMLRCDRLPCDGPCVCCHDTKGLIADCRGANLTELPTTWQHLNNLTQVIASDNFISTLPVRLPYGLDLLDMRHNSIRHLDKQVVSALFSSPLRHVKISGNIIECSCENQPFIQALQEHKLQVDDFNNLTCIYDNAFLGKVNVTTLCNVQELERTLKLQLLLFIAIAVVMLLLFSLVYYRNMVKVWFFKRGTCLCCVQNNEEFDAERRFDAFLSFSHQDADFTFNQLIPFLKKEYKICVHLWNWFPGEMIPTQILMSVKQSKRTVVVLSKNFLQSSWGKMEFETAYSSSLDERRVRVVMIILDDVLEQSQLEGKLLSYVRYNTYVRWGDPEFWKKLRHAMPPRTVFETEDQELGSA